MHFMAGPAENQSLGPLGLYSTHRFLYAALLLVLVMINLVFGKWFQEIGNISWPAGWNNSDTKCLDTSAHPAWVNPDSRNDDMGGCDGKISGDCKWTDVGRVLVIAPWMSHSTVVT
jgi:hypothetical protein